MGDNTLYIGSFGHRYGGDPCGTYCGYDQTEVEQAVENAMQFEADELPGYCQFDHNEDFPASMCQFCTPDLVNYGTYAQSSPVRYGFLRNLRELREVIRALKDSKVYALER